MTFFKGRLRRVEANARKGPTGRCSKCGLSPDERRPLAVINEEHPEKSFQGDPGERCSSCGQPLYTVLRVVYEGEGATVGREMLR